MLPVGSDHVIPARWVTDVAREWSARYRWPRFVPAIPREFFAAVRADVGGGARAVLDHAADAGHEPGLHRQGRLLRRHQAGRAGRRGRGARGRAALHAGLAARARRTRRSRSTRRGGSSPTVRTTTRSPAPSPTRCTWTCSPSWREAWQRGDAARRGAIAFLTGAVPGAAGAAVTAPRPRTAGAGGDGDARGSRSPWSTGWRASATAWRR